MIKVSTTFIIVLLFAACAPGPPERVSVATAIKRLKPGLKVFQPDGAAPFKTILMFHGAGRGPAWDARYEAQIRQFVAHDYAVVFVDMFASRGGTGTPVFNGTILPKETAGDVMLSLDWASKQPWVDGTKIVAWGYSFGATSVMDALTYSAEGKVPTGLTDRPANGATGFAAVLLTAPWCKADVMGFNLIASVHEEFAAFPPLLALLPMRDTVSNQKLCKKILERNRKYNVHLEIKTYQSAQHRFLFPRDSKGNKESHYERAAAEDATKSWLAFLDRHLK